MVAEGFDLFRKAEVLGAEEESAGVLKLGEIGEGDCSLGKTGADEGS